MLLHEATSNILSGVTGAIWALVFFSIAIGGIGIWRSFEVSKVSIQAKEFRLAGSAIQVINAPKRIDPALCLALNDVGNIKFASPMRASRELEFSALAGSKVETFEVAGHVGQMLQASSPPPTTQFAQSGAWLSTDLAQALGIIDGAGKPLVPTPKVDLVDGRTLPVGGIFTNPNDGRSRLLSYTALIPVAPSGFFDFCWAQIWPQAHGQAKDASKILYSALIGTGELSDTKKHLSEVEIFQFNPTLGASLDPVERLRQSPSAAASALAFLVGLLLGMLLTIPRRLELASALHAGIDKASLLWQILIETLFWLIPALLVASLGIYWVAVNNNPDPIWPACLSGLRVIAAGATGTILSALAATAIIKEKLLFSYFKQR